MEREPRAKSMHEAREGRNGRKEQVPDSEGLLLQSWRAFSTVSAVAAGNPDHVQYSEG